MADVFISYSSKDRAVGNMVCALLEERGHRCWIAPRDILPGREWGEAIVQGIRDARVFVLIFSQNANTSPQILREVERAVNNGMPIIPFRIEDVLPERSLEYFMSVPHWLDALTPPVEGHIARLADVIEQLVSGAVDAGDYRAPVRPANGLSWANPLVRAGVGGAVLAALLIAAWLGGLAPPESASGWLTALVALILPVGVVASGRTHGWTRRGVRNGLIALLLIGALGYGWGHSNFVVAGENGAPLVRGTTCTADAALVYGTACPALPSDALADAAFDAASLWTAASIARVGQLLALAWMLIAVSAALLVSGWMGAQPRPRASEG